MNNSIDKEIVRLYSSEDNTVIVARASEIMYVNEDPNGGGTKAYTVGDEQERGVNGTPDRLYARIFRNLGFVRVHRSSDNKPELFNPETFVAADREEDETIVYLRNGCELAVNETPESVLNLLSASRRLLEGFPPEPEPRGKNAEKKLADGSPGGTSI